MPVRYNNSSILNSNPFPGVSASIFLIFYKYERTSDDTERAKTLFMRHIDHFNKNYVKSAPKETKI